MTKRSRFGFSLIELSIVILVIGILVIGITKGSRVISEANLKSARALTASSPATSIPDLLMWLDATSDKAFIDSERSDGGAVSNWYNNNPQRIGGGNNVAQTNATKKPLYIRSSIGSLPAIRFDGIDDFLTSNLSSDTTVNLPTGNSPRTLFIVFGNASGNSGSWNFVFHYGTEGQDDRTFDLGACLTNSGGNPASLHMWNTEYVTNVKSGCDGKRYVAAVTYKGVSGSSTSNGISFYINSTYYPNNNAIARTDSSHGSSAPLTLNTTSNNLHIGSRMNGANPFKGDVGEVIMFGRRLSDNERISVENYLKQKWQIQ